MKSSPLQHPNEDRTVNLINVNMQIYYKFLMCCKNFALTLSRTKSPTPSPTPSLTPSPTTPHAIANSHIFGQMFHSFVAFLFFHKSPLLTRLSLGFHRALMEELYLFFLSVYGTNFLKPLVLTDLISVRISLQDGVYAVSED